MDIERALVKESIKYPVLTIDKAKFFMERLTKGDVKDFFFREKLIDTFINRIVVCNDKIAILYNVQDGYLEHPIYLWLGLAGATGIEPVTYGFGVRHIPFRDVCDCT